MDAKTELEKNAIADSRRKALESFQLALGIQWLNSRMEDSRMGRCLALIQREAEMEKQYQERTDHAAIVNAQAEKETALGIEIAKVSGEEANLLLRRYYLRERDPSLVTLARKLQAGYVCRDLRQQIRNKEYKRLQEKAEEQRASSILRQALYNDQQMKERENQEKLEQCSKYCKELQQQLVNRQRQKQCQYEDTLIEKKMLDEIMRTISDEDQRELKQKRELMEKTRQEMVTFAAARDAWRRKQKLLAVSEERQLEEQRRAAAHRSAAIIAERERKMREKEEINEKISAKILADEAARMERENTIKLLQELEQHEKSCQHDSRQRARHQRLRQDTRRALSDQLQHRRRLAHEDKLKEADFRKQVEAKLAADLEKEREKERERKEKNRQYSKHLLQQIEDNARRRQKEQQLEEGRAKYIQEYDRAWRNEVAEERKKIVQEHVPHVLGYLQAGVVQHEDLPAVKEGARNLPELDIDSLTVSGEIKRRPKCNAQCRVIREY